MNTEQFEARQQRVGRFLETEIGKAFLAYKVAIVAARRLTGDDHYQALQDAQEAEDRLIEISEVLCTR